MRQLELANEVVREKAASTFLPELPWSKARSSGAILGRFWHRIVNESSEKQQRRVPSEPGTDDARSADTEESRKEREAAMEVAVRAAEDILQDRRGALSRAQGTHCNHMISCGLLFGAAQT
ncbi:hypothetical protein [Neorhizobium sp. LjRoot104]|uniref:hypothetical protein n=1 Tax=Neorhizobium sp. LjRoot104 TaxID=3342254 RepID=UPI003ECD79D9